MNEMKKYLTIPQAARYCSVDRVTMWRWVKTRNLKAAVTLGDHHRILREDIETFLLEKGICPYDQKQCAPKRILIVDDHKVVQEVIIKMLRPLDYEVDIASDGFEAGIKVMQFRPDLIILDLFMPGMDGFDVCRLIKGDSSTSHIKIVVLTGCGSVENEEKIMNAGADAFLEKPVARDILLQILDNVMNDDHDRLCVQASKFTS